MTDLEAKNERAFAARFAFGKTGPSEKEAPRRKEKAELNFCHWGRRTRKRRREKMG